MSAQLTDEEALNRVASYCSTAEHCRAEINEKLQRWGIAYDTIARILDRLESEKFIDDERFCRAFVNDKFRFAKWGKMKIAQGLYMKKIPSDVAWRYLNEIDEEEYLSILRDLPGWKSPFYCDNRKTLSYPSLRNFVKIEITRLILERFGQVDAIAGVATGAIPQGALVADALNLPFVYVRSTPKDHGLENLIEGELRPGMKVVVVEDLISTGGSSLKAVEAIRRDGCEVIGMVAAYTYGFPVAEEAFKNAKVTLVTLTNYEAVLDVALRTGYIEEEDIQTLNEWRKDPAHWDAGK